jgi:ABC-type branched-subunit amino acid transport system permease subunit
MTLFLVLCGLSAVVGCFGGRFLAWPLAFALGVFAAAILPIAATVLVWPPQERTFRGILNNSWFSHETVGFLAIPWIACLVLAVVGVIAGLWLRRASKI